MEFFLGFYEFLEKDLVRVIEESRVFGRIVAAFNTTFIALIPKFYNSFGFDECMPISLSNCIYKIISKIISKRMKELLSKTVSQEQFGFLARGRYMKLWEFLKRLSIQLRSKFYLPWSYK
jgi:hypothetical protein